MMDVIIDVFAIIGVMAIIFLVWCAVSPPPMSTR